MIFKQKEFDKLSNLEKVYATFLGANPHQLKAVMNNPTFKQLPKEYQNEANAECWIDFQRNGINAEMMFQDKIREIKTNGNNTKNHASDY